jgi:hypothetical protein
VLPAVEFDDQTAVVANEIQNVVLKRNLTTEFETRQSSVTQQAPHGALGVGRIVSEFAGIVAQTSPNASMMRTAH